MPNWRTELERLLLKRCLENLGTRPGDAARNRERAIEGVEEDIGEALLAYWIPIDLRLRLMMCLCAKLGLTRSRVSVPFRIFAKFAFLNRDKVDEEDSAPKIPMPVAMWVRSLSTHLSGLPNIFRPPLCRTLTTAIQSGVAERNLLALA